MIVPGLIDALIAYLAPDAKAVGHTLKVYAYSLGIAGGEGVAGDDLKVLAASALLHDIGIPESRRRHGSDDGAYQEKYGPPIAGDMLAQIGFDPALAARVLFAVGHHHSYGAEADLPLRILFEADFLVNFEERNVPRETAPEVGRNVFQTGTGKRYLQALFLGNS